MKFDDYCHEQICISNEMQSIADRISKKAMHNTANAGSEELFNLLERRDQLIKKSEKSTAHMQQQMKACRSEEYKG